MDFLHLQFTNDAQETFKAVTAEVVTDCCLKNPNQCQTVKLR